jgi:hypothetical protein
MLEYGLLLAMILVSTDESAQCQNPDRSAVKISILIWSAFVLEYCTRHSCSHCVVRSLHGLCC